MVLLILGGAGPSIVGISMVLLTYDKERRRDFWMRCFFPGRIGAFWWGIIWLLFPLICVTSVALNVVFGGSMPGMEQLQLLIANSSMWPFVAFISFMSGPWQRSLGGAAMHLIR